MRIQNLSQFLNKTGAVLPQFLLVYGNNEGAIQFTIDVLSRQVKSRGFTVKTMLDVGQVTQIQEPDMFADASAKTCTFVRGITGRDFDAIQTLMSTVTQSDDMYVFVAGNLGSKIKLVKTFQDQKDLGAVGCYDISGDMIRATLLSELKSRNVNLSPTQIDAMVATYSGSPISLFSDVEKIALFTNGADEIDTTELLTLVNGASKMSVDDIVAGFLKRDRAQLLSATPLDLLEAEPYFILRSLSRTLMQFCEFMAYMAHEHNPSIALQKLSVPVFFQTKSLFQNCTSVWSEKLVAIALRHLLILERDFKNGSLSLSQFQAELALFSR